MYGIDTLKVGVRFEYHTILTFEMKKDPKLPCVYRAQQHSQTQRCTC